MAYFNILPLIAAALPMIASALAPTILEKGGELVGGLLGKKGTPAAEPFFQRKPRESSTDKLYKLIEVEKALGRH